MQNQYRLNYHNYHASQFDDPTTNQYLTHNVKQPWQHETYMQARIYPHSIISALFALIMLVFCNASNAGETKILVDQSLFEQVLATALSGDGDRLKSFADAQQLNALDSQGLSAVLHTVKLDRLDATQLLINAGANIDEFDPDLSKSAIDQTAFLYAGATGNNAALKLLLKAGAQVDIYNYYGGTALIPAAEKGFVSTVKLLLEESKTNVNHVNNLGWTALMEAVVLSNGGPDHQQIVELLLAHGADPDIADRKGVTALQHAQSKGFDEIVQLLSAHRS